MRANSRRTYLVAVVVLGAAALAVDRAVLQPSAAQAAPPGPALSEAPAEPAGSAAPLPPPSVPVLAGRLETLAAPEVTPDIFRADPAEWGLTTPGASERPAEVELRLTAIMNADASAGSSASCAVINARIARVGQTVAGYTVESITPTAVRLRRGDQTRELRLAR
jgi:hypothetical protein